MLSSKYLIIGAGETGLHLAKELSLLGEHVVLIEQDAFGGSYLHSLDIPKFWLKHEAKSFGFALEIFRDYQSTFQTLLNYRKSIKDLIQEKIMATYQYFLDDYEKTPNLHIVAGKASFSSKNLIEISNSGVKELITFENLILAVGKNSLITPTLFRNKGIKFLHQYSAFEFSKIPNSILIIGFNADNLEIADMYACLGIAVSIIDEKSIYDVIPSLDNEAIDYLEKHLESLSIKCYFESVVLEVTEGKKVSVQVQQGQKIWIREYESVFIQVQETFVDKGLGLSRVGINYDINGIYTDSRCRTEVANVWAFGDCNARLTQSNKLSKSTDFLFNVRRKSQQARLWDMAGISEGNQISNNHINLEIKISKPIYALGITEKQGESIYSPDLEVEIIQKIDQEGFLKIWFRQSSGLVIGSIMAGEMSQYRHYVNAAISRNISAMEVIRYIIGD